MVVINDSTPLCNYGLYLSTILTSTDYYGEVITHRNRTVTTTYSTYIHHTTESCKETKRPPSSAITSERLNRLRLKRQVSVHSLAYVIGVLNQAICIAPLDLLGAGISAHGEASTCKQAFDSPRPKSQDCFSVRHLDDRTDGVSQYRGETMSSSFENGPCTRLRFRRVETKSWPMHSPTLSACCNRGKTMSLQRNTLSAALYIPLA